MGCDGGTIPRRDELVKVKRKPEKKDREAELAYRWRHCSIRQLPLQTPIVACGLGRLYSKEAVLEGLLDRSTLPESASHLKSLKDVKNLNLTSNPAFDKNASKNEGDVDHGRSPYICPISGLEMNGKFKFCFLWQCGCVISERALKEIKSNNCHNCQKPFTGNDIIILNAEGEDLTLMQENINLRKLEKKSKKRKNNSPDAEEKEKEESSNKSIKKEKKEKATSTVTSKTKVKIEPQDPLYNKVKKNYSVAQDPNASEVLKSIFTTHQTAAEQTKAHWVTYNPFYN